MARGKAEEVQEENLVQNAKDDICRLISYACTQCIDGKTREKPEVIFSGIAALYSAIK